MGTHTGSHGALATSLNELWIKECWQNSNTAGELKGFSKGLAFENPFSMLEQFFLTGERLIDSRLHRLNSTPRAVVVNRIRGSG